MRTMAARIKPWEAGSEFHWMPLAHGSRKPYYLTAANLYSCGRSALAGILQYGREVLGWKRLWIPSYYCPEVVETIFATGISAEFYFDSPMDQVIVPRDILPGDAILIVNFFGVKSREEYEEIFRLEIPVIEDHSHDPWSLWVMQSQASYLTASLRKTLPIPDGGATWSNIGSHLPPQPAQKGQSSNVSVEKIEAMLLKTLYLAGKISDKERYLELFNSAKHNLCLSTVDQQCGEEPISELSKGILTSFPWRGWRAKRLANYRRLRQQVLEKSGMKILESNDRDVCPFMMTVLFSTRKKRDQMKKRLIKNSIYPAIIWPIEESHAWASERAKILSGQILSIHCDGRYSLTDMDKIAAIFNQGIVP